MCTIVSTVNGPWGIPVTLVDRTSRRQFLRDVWCRSHDHDVVVVLGSVGYGDRYIDLLAVLMLKLRRNPPAIVITDATWEVGSASLAADSRWRARAVSIAARMLIKWLDGPNVTYGVLSTQEVREFPVRWGVDADRVVFTPFYWTLRSFADDEVERGEHVFAGGDSLRDYQLLLDAVDPSGVPVTIASSWRPDQVPDNLEVGWMSQEAYMGSLLASNLVVVPLQQAERSAGQQTYLNAMASGKVVIVTEAPGVRDYVEHGRTGMVVAPDPVALRSTLEALLDPKNRSLVEEIGQRARSVARERFSEERYCERLAGVATQAARRWSQVRSGT